MTTENPHPPTTPQQPEIPEKSKISNGTILNVVLFLGLIVLYALHFFPREQAAADDMPLEEKEIANLIAEGTFHIAFVNSDTLMANYKLSQKMITDFEAEQRRLENDLQRRQREFQAEVETFERQIQSGTISMENAQIKEQELRQTQHDLMQLNETYSTRLMRTEMEMNVELYQKITDMLERFNKDMGYDYILGFSPGGGILYAKEKHDITQKVLNLLNQEFDAQKE